MKKSKATSLSTAKMRELGIELQRIRKREGYGGGDLGRLLDCNASTVSRLENGLSKVEDGKVALYLARANATPAELHELVALDRCPDDGYQIRPHPAGSPDRLPIVTMLDRESASITSYAPVEVPHYLQVESYIRDALTQFGYDERALDLAVKSRLSRHPSSLRRRGTFTVYLSEVALHGELGNLTITHEQLAYLTAASSLPPFRIHLVPAGTALTGIQSGFTLYRHSKYRPVLHLQQPTISVFLENDTDITFYESCLQHIAGLALDRDETRAKLVARLAEIKPQSG